MSKYPLNVLPLTLVKNSYTYVQVSREERYAIYRQCTGQKTIAFEVFRVKIQKERTFRDRLFPRKEVFPSNEDFGYTAYSCRSLEDAHKRLEYLKNR